MPRLRAPNRNICTIGPKASITGATNEQLLLTAGVHIQIPKICNQQHDFHQVCLLNLLVLMTFIRAKRLINLKFSFPETIFALNA